MSSAPSPRKAEAMDHAPSVARDRDARRARRPGHPRALRRGRRGARQGGRLAGHGRRRGGRGGDPRAPRRAHAGDPGGRRGDRRRGPRARARRRPLLAGRSARRHQGVHQPQRRVHGQHRAGRGRRAGARRGPGAGARQGLVGGARPGRADCGTAAGERPIAVRRAAGERRGRGRQPLAQRCRRPRPFSTGRASPSGSRPAARSSSAWSPRAAPTSIRASARPWSGTPPPATPCSRAAGGKVTTRDGAPFRYRKPGFRNPEFIARGA